MADHVRENQRIKVKNSYIIVKSFRKLNNAGEIFITEKGVVKYEGFKIGGKIPIPAFRDERFPNA
ncbi:hypothetical protein [Clostridium felsineum]|uniref:hypothetical protein n=1 Tax=Clostridium felsineum TaxID=36839 RepID=UPI00098C2991|nr:hypothetical protein [Clostridium felsineum]URZ18781.1 hypothetical protein CLFE_048690 [Clostridium felsineum DSM 794]